MHVTKRAAGFAIAAASLIAISLPFAMTATAQTTTDQQVRTRQAPPQGGGAAAGPGQFQGQDRFRQVPGDPNAFGQPQAGQFRPGGGMGGGGGTAMTIDNQHLYVVQGNMVFKIRKDTMRIESSTSLMPMNSGPTFGSTPLPQPDRRNIPPSGGAGGGGGK